MNRPLALLATVLASAVSVSAAEKPNIIFILADDLGFGDVGVFFQNARKAANKRSEPWHITPRLDAMAAEGIQLPHHYCPAPVCAPSRASLLTGLHQGHAGVRDNQFDKALENNHTIATVLKAAGYATAAIGKWGLQGQAQPAPPNWPAHPLNRGFDYYYGYMRHKDGHAQYPKEDLKEVWENRTEVSGALDGCYTTDLFTARAKQWVIEQKTAAPDKPFFLYLAYPTPHAKLQLPASPFPEGGGLNGGLKWTGAAGQMINTATGKPDSYVHPDYSTATWDHDANPESAEQAWPDVYQRYATDVRRIDDCVGDLIQLLQDLKIDRDTLVVFSTDNGPSKESYLPENYSPAFFNSFGPFDGTKRDLWEGGIRVGAIARWPSRIPANRTTDSPSQFHDWLPTFAEMAKLPAPARTDGVSLIPTLTGEGVQNPSTVYVEYFHGQSTPTYPEFAPDHRGRPRKQMQAIRMGSHMGVRYQINSHAVPFEIYDVVADPQQRKNLAAEKAELQQKMHDTVLQIRRPQADAARPYDQEFIPSVPDDGLQSGLQWKTFTEEFPWVPKLDHKAGARSGNAANFGDIPLPIGTTGVMVTGTFPIPEDSEHTISVAGDQPAVLRLHDALLLDRGIGQASDPARRTVKLKAGQHPFRLYVLTDPSSPKLPSLEWVGPGKVNSRVPPSQP